MGTLIALPFQILWWLFKLALGLLAWLFAVTVVIVGALLGIFFQAANNRPPNQAGQRHTGYHTGGGL